MRHFNRILGFVAVSFVLVFLGKVNKVSLYTAYFKTIADVEVRNSTALDHGDVQFVAATPERAVPRLRPLDAGHVSVPAPVSLPVCLVAARPVAAPHAPQATAVAMRCFMEVAPRAPGA